MNTPQDTRWHHRYQQYCNAFTLLEQAIRIQQPSVVERAGIITTHTYNEATAIVVEQKIRDDYYPHLVQLSDRFAGMLKS